MPSVAWKQIERVILGVGILGACAALATGDTAEHFAHPARALVEMHSNVAALATWIYGAILAGEILAFGNQKYASKFSPKNWIVKLSRFGEKVLYNQVVAKILAFLGFIAIALTGLLGGAMVYGASADPIAAFVLKLLGV